jgi:NAD(P)H-hydrate repair Nnr-like enzyme with NAD(P)H-hydrate epimerase domain
VKHLAVPGLLFGGVALAGCSSTLDSSSAEKSIAKVFAQSGHPTKKVDCPDDVDAKKGKAFDCTITLSNGQTFKAHAVQTDDNGHFQVSLPSS